MELSTMFSALAAGSLNLLDPVNLLVMFVGVAIAILFKSHAAHIFFLASHL